MRCVTSQDGVGFGLVVREGGAVPGPAVIRVEAGDVLPEKGGGGRTKALFNWC